MVEPIQPKEKWYFKKRSIVIAVLLLGPLALPMIWLNPRNTLTTKIIWTVVILLMAWAMVVYTQVMLTTLEQRLADLQSISA